MEIIITGNLASDIDIRYFETGKVKAVFSVATNTYNPATKEKEASFFNIAAWEKQAEFIGEKFKKGDKISIACWYKQDKYTGKDGAEKTKDIYTVRDIIFTEAYAVLNGAVEKEETRTQNDKFIQYGQFSNSSVTIINKNESVAFEKGKCYTVMGVLHYSKDKKLLLDAISIYEGNNNIEFAENEITEEIPF